MQSLTKTWSFTTAAIKSTHQARCLTLNIALPPDTLTYNWQTINGETPTLLTPPPVRASRINKGSDMLTFEQRVALNSQISRKGTIDSVLIKRILIYFKRKVSCFNLAAFAHEGFRPANCNAYSLKFTLI